MSDESSTSPQRQHHRPCVVGVRRRHDSVMQTICPIGDDWNLEIEVTDFRVSRASDFTREVRTFNLKPETLNVFFSVGFDSRAKMTQIVGLRQRAYELG